MEAAGCMRGNTVLAKYSFPMKRSWSDCHCWFCNVLGALQGMFDQIMGGDEAVREKGIDYLRTSLMDMRHKLFIPSKENEVFLVEQIKKVCFPVPL